MDYLWAYVVTALFAAGGYLIFGVGRFFSSARRRRHELRMARVYAEAEHRRAELEADTRKMELADEMYQDFKRRHPQSP